MAADKTKLIKQYTGRLTPSQIAEGCNLATKNAKRLVNDAKILLDAERFGSAASLAILSIEESGKHGLLRLIAMAEDDKELKEAWKYYRTHARKNRLLALPLAVKEGAKSFWDIGRKLFGDTNQYASLIDQIKQTGFYTDCIGDGRWISPEDMPQGTALGLVSIAKWLSEKEPISSREIELLIEHMRPVWKKHEEVAELGLLKWFKALQEEGLFPKDVDIAHLITGEIEDA